MSTASLNPVHLCTRTVKLALYIPDALPKLILLLGNYQNVLMVLDL